MPEEKFTDSTGNSMDIRKKGPLCLKVVYNHRKRPNCMNERKQWPTGIFWRRPMLDLKFVRENPGSSKTEHPQQIPGCEAADGR